MIFKLKLKKFIKDFLEKESIQLGIIIFILSLLLLKTGVGAALAGDYIRAIVDIVVVFFAQYDFWTKWRHKVDA